MSRHAACMDRHDIGALGDDRDCGVAVAARCFRRWRPRPNGMISTPVMRRSSASRPVGVELNAADAHRLQLHLGLPLIDLGQRLRRQRRQEPLRAQLDKPRLRFAKFRRAEAFRALRRR